jgi:peptidoglycan hydrolase-like protein with peptidoglycan-binding domain
MSRRWTRLPIVRALVAFLLLAGLGALESGCSAGVHTASADVPKRGQRRALPHGHRNHPRPSGPTRVIDVSVSASHPLLDGTAPIRVWLSGRPAANAPRPTLMPDVPGAWSAVGGEEQFAPATTLAPCADYTLMVPGATVAVGHTPLGSDTAIDFHVACPSARGLQDALARLGWLPDTAPIAGNAASTVVAGSAPAPVAVAAHHAFNPPAGDLRPTLPGAPPLVQGVLDTTTSGALMSFQAAHGLDPDGVPGEKTWTALLLAEARSEHNPRPYTWVTVSKRAPETLELHRGANLALTTPTSTGVAGATTPNGIFPIFARAESAEMKGTDTDGKTYDIPGVPWVVYFHEGDAIHGYDRASYGQPQSNGCVELPPSIAETVYKMLDIGDLVVVSG